MVAGLARKKKSHAQYVEPLSAEIAELETRARDLADAMDRDAASYDAVLAAFKMPKESAEDQRRRDAAIEAATRGATEVPMGVAEAAADLLERLRQLEGITPASMASDLRVGKLMATAAANGALANVQINLETLSDSAYISKMNLRGAAVEARLAPRPAIAVP
jgi:formiminotetrahydrofolate cyclodeaminase